MHFAVHRNYLISSFVCGTLLWIRLFRGIVVLATWFAGRTCIHFGYKFAHRWRNAIVCGLAWARTNSLHRFMGILLIAGRGGIFRFRNTFTIVIRFQIERSFTLAFRIPISFVALLFCAVLMQERCLFSPRTNVLMQFECTRENLIAMRTFNRAGHRVYQTMLIQFHNRTKICRTQLTAFIRLRVLM